MEEKIDAHKWKLKILPNNFCLLKIAKISNITFWRTELYFSKKYIFNIKVPNLLFWYCSVVKVFGLWRNQRVQTPTRRTSLKFLKCQNRTGGSLKMGEPHNAGRNGCSWPRPSPNTDGMAPKKSRVTPRVALCLSSRSLSCARIFASFSPYPRRSAAFYLCDFSWHFAFFRSSFVAHTSPASICTLISPIYLQLVGSLLFICSASKSLMTVWWSWRAPEDRNRSRGIRRSRRLKHGHQGYVSFPRYDILLAHWICMVFLCLI